MRSTRYVASSRKSHTAGLLTTHLFVTANHLWYDRIVFGHGAFLLAKGAVWELPLFSFIVCEADEQPRVL